ncbi:MAG: LysR family transcriptional regulator [Polyangiaceae bacterium]|nr:LysR family transcriptional regulator [Polyangiaceae bacterium]
MVNGSTPTARDLDLNLLRVFVVVAEAGGVTAAASKLYLTQPAVSAALKRLSAAIGAPLFAKQGRHLALTSRGERFLQAVRPHLAALSAAAAAPAAFDPAESERTLRLGLSDAAESWLLPLLLRDLGRAAPRLRLIVTSVTFRTVAAALSSGAAELAVTVADEVPAGTLRRTLFVGGFVCLFDPRFARLGPRLTRKKYLDHEHVIVSYNGDLRGLVEDLLGVRRRVRVSVPSFHAVGKLVEGSALLATVPALVAQHLIEERPKLRAMPLPFELPRTPMEVLWRGPLADDPAVLFVIERIVKIAKGASNGADR